MAATDVTSSLTINASHIGRQINEQDKKDADQGWRLLSVLAGEDIAQGAVIAGGQCLGIESIQGTNALLKFVAQTPEHLKQGARGVFVKRPKPGQDGRMDIPTIGPDTVRAVAAAGLGGIVLEEGVIALDRAEIEHLISKHDLFLDVRKGQA